MQAYGHKRIYHIYPGEFIAGRPEPRKQAPKGTDSARRKAARQEAQSVIKSAIFH